MGEPQFDPAVQKHANGPLSDDFKKRILYAKEKHGLGYGKIATWAGFSGSFLGNVTRYDTNIGIQAATQLYYVIRKLEELNPGSDVVGMFTKAHVTSTDGVTDSAPPIEEERKASPSTPDSGSIEHAISVLRKHGFGVILTSGSTVALPLTIVGGVSP